MKTAVAVYTSSSSLNGRKLADLAWAAGIQLRFMALGGYIPSNADEIQKKSLSTINGGAMLVVGAFDDAGESMAEFDSLVEIGDRLPIAEMLNGVKLPWCELYTSRFDYEKTVRAKPKDQPKIDGSVPKAHLSSVKAAKTRYIIYNQSRKKNCQQLMTRLADCIASHTNGVVADYQRTSR
ncbi:hypothetical protein Poly51_11590 [Rubripirellula tenax]|uniref:Uncharacterized protein n=1 Tax=Rubripirellula tenax TaxID=2528015 RepID=A0A5C6FLI2_9BACT|nr:hypothetical protein [Rubripirellula tenax]TWU60877.1 hypothetical protein Poly51_11590 [Rubripirellula tenax]